MVIEQHLIIATSRPADTAVTPGIYITCNHVIVVLGHFIQHFEWIQLSPIQTGQLNLLPLYQFMQHLSIRIVYLVIRPCTLPAYICLQTRKRE